MVSRQMIKTAAKDAWNAKQMQRAQDWINSNFDVNGVGGIIQTLDKLVNRAEELLEVRSRLEQLNRGYSE